MNRKHIVSILSLLAVALIGLAPLGQAQTTTWLGGDGSFNDSAKWSDGVPGSTSIWWTTLFNPPTSGEDTVTIPTSPSNVLRFLYIEGGGAGDIVFNYENGSVIQVGHDGYSDFEFRNPGSDNRTLTLTGTGGLDVVGRASVGVSVDGGQGWSTVVVKDGATMGSSRTDTGERSWRIGGSAPGAILVQDGGTLSFANPGASTPHVVGSNAEGLLHVSGTGVITAATGSNNWLYLGNHTAGSGTTGTLKVSDGGTFTGAWNRLYVGNASGATGVVEVSGSNQIKASTLTMSAGFLWLAPVAGSTGLLKISDGGVVSVGHGSTTSRVYAGGTVDIDRGSMTVGQATHTTNFVFEVGATYKLALHGENRIGAVGYVSPMKYAATGEILLTNSDVNFVLSLGDGFSAGIGDVFTVLDYSSGTLNGEFAGLTNGATIAVDDYEFEIYYNYGGADQIALLTTIPEPNSLGLILLGLGAVSVRRFRRRG